MRVNKKRVRVFGDAVSQIFRNLAEIASIMLLVGFVASTVANQLIFSEWGFVFVNLATPTDVLMSGMGLLIDTLFPSFVIFVSIFAVAFFFGEKRANQYEVDEGIMGKGNRIEIGLCVSTAVMFYYPVTDVVLGHYLYGPENTRAFVDVNQAANRAIVQFNFAIMFLAAFLSRNAVRWLTSNPTSAVANFGVFCSTLLIVLGLYNLVIIRSELGYQRPLLEISGLSGDPCGASKPLAMWIGDEAIVFTCPGTRAFSATSKDGALVFERAAAVGLCTHRSWLPLFHCSIEERNNRLAADDSPKTEAVR